ncbi:MAG: site-specific integrase, partial [Thermoanaerobaculia bacterium]|nr:site-specific integrase [Thermoanaerobaculia bacterium]
EGAAPGPKGPPPTTANRWTGAVRACFSAAIRAGHLSMNPARGHTPLLEAAPRARVLSPDEMERFLRALEAEPDVHVRAGFRLLVETGARLSEVLRARWADVDLDAGLWRIPSPKSGHPQVVPLGSRTVAMLARLSRKGPYVVAGRKAEEPRADLKKPWERLRTEAALGDVRIHDIRRSFGLEVAKKAGLHVASKLLRHSSIKVTEAAYAPLGLDELREAVEKRADVLPFPEQKKSAG